jgi:hypothetical protein
MGIFTTNHTNEEQGVGLQKSPTPNSLFPILWFVVNLFSILLRGDTYEKDIYYFSGGVNYGVR